MRGSSILFTTALLAVTSLSGVLAAPAATYEARAEAASAKPAAEPAAKSDAKKTDAKAPTKSPATKAPAAAAGGAAPAAPHFVLYTDKGNEPAPPVAKISGFNTVMMSFLLSTAAADEAKAWETMPKNQRTSIRNEYKKAGIKLLVSAFGQSDIPTSKPAKTVAGTMAKWVKANDVDGIDVDYEDIAAMNAQDGKAEQWLIDFTKALRAELPQGKYILTHAPLAPWFSPSHYKSGGYTKVNKEVGSMIDWYNIQYYNDKAEYTNCDTLLTKSSFTGSAVFEIIKGGVPAAKVVIGKPGGTGDAPAGGYMAPAALAQCVAQAKKKNWNGGVMSWEYPEADTKWIKTVKGSAFK